MKSSVRRAVSGACVGLALAAVTVRGQEGANLYWGDTHLHTMNSLDAYSTGNFYADPDTAYRFAKGLPVLHPSTRARVRIVRPLDFLVVSDHAEQMALQAEVMRGKRLGMLFGFLRDPSRAVRREVAGLLAGADGSVLTIEQRMDLQTALTRHRQWLAGDADRAEALVTLAGLQAATGDPAAARAMYEQAIRQDELSLVALLNYADFHRAYGDDDSADRLLTKAAELYPDAAAVHFALGLLRVRQDRHAEAVPELARAVELSPHESGYAYVHAVALYSTGQTDRALSALEGARRRFPANEPIRSALEAYCADTRQASGARRDGADRAPEAARCMATAPAR